MKRRDEMKLNTFMIEDRVTNKYDLAAILTLSDAENGVRLTASTQRKVLGQNYFGKREIVFKPELVQVWAYRKVCFGMDWDIEIFNLKDLV